MSEILCRVVSLKKTDTSEVRTAFINLMSKAHFLNLNV
jgi:hypothetical protein